MFVLIQTNNSLGYIIYMHLGFKHRAPLFEERQQKNKKIKKYEYCLCCGVNSANTVTHKLIALFIISNVIFVILLFR